MNDEEREALKEELKKKVDEMTDEELEQVSGGFLGTIKQAGEAVAGIPLESMKIFL